MSATPTPLGPSPNAWSRETALKTAQSWGLKLSQEAWAIIEATRDFAQTNGHLPDLNQVVDEVGRSLHWGRKHSLAMLYKLFRAQPLERLVVLAGLTNWPH